MEKSPKKKIDKLNVETAAIEANNALSFLYIGLSQSEWALNSDCAAGAADMVLDIHERVRILTDFYYQTVSNK